MCLFVFWGYVYVFMPVELLTSKIRTVSRNKVTIIQYNNDDVFLTSSYCQTLIKLFHELVFQRLDRTF